MRGLPPPPPQVARAQLEITTRGQRATIANWIYIPNLPAATFGELDAIAGQVRQALVDFAINLMSVDGEPTEFRWFTYGDNPYSTSAAVGGFTGGRLGLTPINASTGVYWATNHRGKSGRCITHVPAFPESFTDDYVHVNGNCIDAVNASCSNYLEELSLIDIGPGLTTSLVTLHSQSNGVPLPEAEFRFIDHGTVAPLIAGMQRRLQSNR